MNKKILSIILCLFVSFSLFACKGNEQPTNEGNSTEISASDLVRPGESNVVYTDYSLLSDGSGHPDYNEAKWYRNDLKDLALPDPYVLEVDGIYYIYGTTDRTGSRTIDCYSTTDFHEFTWHKDVFTAPADSWETNSGGIFAPEMFVYEGEYYLYFGINNKSNGMRYINCAKAATPTGPFLPIYQENAFGEMVDGKAEPIFNHNDSIGLSVLDQTIFQDDDGKIYMYYSVYDTGKSQYIVGFEMLDPITPLFDTYKILVRPGELTPATTSSKILAWEAYTDFEVAEGPFMIKSPNGKYYLTYSVNHYPNRFYTVCYAESDSPLGDYTKPYTKENKENGETWTNLLFGYAGGHNGTKVHDQWKGFMSGTAHHCFFKIGDQWMIGYHAHKNRDNSENGRMFAMDYIYFDENGVPYAEGPTYSIQPLPEAISGYKNIAVNANVKYQNVEHAERINDNYIVEHYNLKQNQDKEVILKEGKAYIELVFDKEYYIGGISIYNSAFYDKALTEIDYINFFNGNAVFNVGFIAEYLNEDSEFIFPTSSFVVEFDEDIKASKVLIAVDTLEGAQINEIKVFGREVN